MTAGYSKRPLSAKLGIAPHSQLLVVAAPPDFAALLDPLPENVHTMHVSATEIRDLSWPAGSLPYVHIFTKARGELATLFPILKTFIRPNGMLWVSWPKRASKIPTDLDGNVVREIGLDTGLVDVKVAAIDNVWSGLKFVYRLSDR